METFLQRGEEILWQEQSRYLFTPHIQILAILSLLPLPIYGVLLLDCYDPGGMNPEEAKYLLFLPGLSVLVWLLIGALWGKYRRTLYLLTNQRALIIRNPHHTKQRLVAIPVSPRMINEIVQHRFGKTSYIMKEHTAERLNHTLRFEGVRNVQELERQFSLLGIKLPLPRKTTAKSTRPASISRLIGWLFILILFLSLLGNRAIEEPDFLLNITGKRATATIIGYQQRTQKEGGKAKQYVTRHHPVLQFHIDDDVQIQAIDAIGDKRPIEPIGKTVDILYHPKEPTIVNRVRLGRFIGPSVITLVHLGLLFLILKELCGLLWQRRAVNKR